MLKDIYNMPSVMPCGTFFIMYFSFNDTFRNVYIAFMIYWIVLSLFSNLLILSSVLMYEASNQTQNTVDSVDSVLSQNISFVKQNNVGYVKKM